MDTIISIITNILCTAFHVIMFATPFILLSDKIKLSKGKFPTKTKYIILFWIVFFIMVFVNAGFTYEEQDYWNWDPLFYFVPIILLIKYFTWKN